jgi:hypothetical protein
MTLQFCNAKSGRCCWVQSQDNAFFFFIISLDENGKLEKSWKMGFKNAEVTSGESMLSPPCDGTV